jgi:hypothetical protein
VAYIGDKLMHPLEVGEKSAPFGLFGWRWCPAI